MADREERDRNWKIAGCRRGSGKWSEKEREKEERGKRKEEGECEDVTRE